MIEDQQTRADEATELAPTQRPLGIVVGVDDSAIALAALDRAVEESLVSTWPLTVAHAWICEPGAASNDEAQAWLDELVSEALARSQSDPPPLITCRPVQGAAREVLTDLSRMAQLLVVGGRDPGLLRSTLLGSTTAHVLHHAHCPVMLVPEVTSYAGLPDRVIVGVDGSEQSHEALRWAYNATQRYDCALLAVRATILPGMDAGEQFPALRTYDQQSLIGFERELNGVLPHAARIEARLCDAAPATALLELVKPSDLLVVGARGRGGISGLLLGSVARRCAEYTKECLVVVPGSVPR